MRCVPAVVACLVVVASLSGCRHAPSGVEVTGTRSYPSRSRPIAGRNWTVPRVGMEFVWLPALGYWVGKYEVTNGEYRAFRPDHDSGSFEAYSLNGDRQPVVCVSFADAKAFATWLTEQERAAGRLPEGTVYRLPTKDEWTALARCGDDRIYPWGNELPPTFGNYVDQAARAAFPGWSIVDGYDDGFAVTCPVERSGANDWGLYGVGGNVWEGTSRTPDGGFDAWRGGAWRYLNLAFLRCDFRFVGDATGRDVHYGFRLVLSR